jgi:hypothetical protein
LVRWHGAERSALGEEPILFRVLERRVEAVVVDGALPGLAEEQRAVVGLDDDVVSA